MLRFRLLFWRLILPKIIEVIDNILNVLLLLISGEKIQGDIMGRLMRKHLDKGLEVPNLIFGETEKMDFFGYKAKRWSVVFYCFVHLFVYIVFFYLLGHRNNLLSAIFRNNFLALCYVVITFSFTESFIPKVLKLTIKKITPKIFEDISFKKLKIPNH